MSNIGVDVSNLNTSWNASAPTQYERRQGGSTHSVARHILSLTPPLNGHRVILDNCCGTGAFTSAILNAASNSKSTTSVSLWVNAIDTSPGMIDIIHSLIATNKWQSSVKAERMDATNMKFPDNLFDVSVTSFGIFFFPDPVQGAKEIYRTLKPGGVAFVTCWKEMTYVPIFYEVQKIIQPAMYIILQMFETWMKKETMEETLKKGGFISDKIEFVSLDVMSIQKDIDEMIDILAIRFRDFVGDEWTENEKMQLHSATRKVMTEQRSTFIVDLDESGKVGLSMCAWIAKGTK